MSETPKRRWLRFSFRTLFVLVTVVGLWLGWNLHQVRQRDAFSKRIGLQEGIFSLHVLERRMPITWSLLGAKREYRFNLRRDEFGDAEIERIRVLFPEAEIGVADYGSHEFKLLPPDE